MCITRRFFINKKPTVNRFFVVWFCLFSSNVSAETLLNEAVAIDLSLAKPEWQTLKQTRAYQAKTEMLAAQQKPNPEFEYEREQVDGNESRYSLSQGFDFSQRRELKAQAAQRRGQVAQLRLQAKKIDLVAQTRSAFYQVLHQQQRLERIDHWLQQLADSAKVIHKRQTAGEISGYDSLRLATEQARASAERQQNQAQQQGLWVTLQSSLGLRPGQYDGLEGELLPEPPPPLADLLNTLIKRPDIAQYSQESQALDLERQVGEQGWIPDVTLGLGIIQSDADNGASLSAAISLPLFDRGQIEQRRASAKAIVNRTEQQLALRTAKAEIQGLWQESQRLTGAAWQQLQTAQQTALRLLKVAKVAYRGGELSILELLDAYRSVHDIELQKLTLAAKARQTQIELDRLTQGK